MVVLTKRETTALIDFLRVISIQSRDQTLEELLLADQKNSGNRDQSNVYMPLQILILYL